MKGTIKIKLGDKVLELSADGSSKDLIKGFSFWSSLPSKCGLCQSPDIALSFRSPKGNDYFGLRCLKCSADLNFGQHKTGGGFFLSSDKKWEKWEPQSGAGDSGQQGTSQSNAQNMGSATPPPQQQEAPGGMW